MKRYLIPIIIILMLALGLIIGCGQSQEPSTTATEDEPIWTEKQGIDHLYTYLVNKTEQLQEGRAQVEKIVINWRFRDAVLEANREALDGDSLEELGKLVETELEQSIPEPGEMSIWIGVFEGALTKLAQYDGDGWWAVAIAGQWQVNERTGEVVACDEEATKRLEEITLKTYHNSKYGYYLDYPPSWVISDEDKSRVLISDNPKDARALVFIVAVDEETLASFGGLRGYIDARLTSFKNEYYAFEMTNVSYLTIDYKYQKKENSPTNEGRLHTFLNSDMLFEIICSGRIIDIPGKSYSNIYDPFDSFRFKP